MLKPQDTVIFANDFHGLINWYRDVLDLTITRLFEGDYHYCSIGNSNGIRLGIADAAEMDIMPNDRKNNSVVLQFQVADVPTFFKHIEANGGSVMFGPSFDKNDQFWFGGIADLEGNPIWIVDDNCP